MKSRPDQFKVNPNQFRFPQTPEVAYLLGFIWGDGYIYKDRTSINIQEEDGVKIFEITKLTGDWSMHIKSPQRYGVTTKNIANIGTNNKLLSNFLREMNYTTKSFSSPDKILSIIPSHLLHFWWRGYFDADGCATMNNKNGYGKRITITSQLKQDWSAVCNLFSTLNVKAVVKQSITKHGSSSYLRACGRKNISLFFRYIYPNGYDNIGLFRKYARLQELVNHIPNRYKNA